MISLSFDQKQFQKEMDNIIQYSLGYIQGIESGKSVFYKNFGKSVIDVMKQYIDSIARVDSQMLHHVYEWNQTGSPDARLFDLEYVVAGNGISIGSTFRQSLSVKGGSTTPFYNKAKIMEDGSPVTIKPKKKVLAFEQNGETVFTQKPVTINNPGGEEVQGGFARTVDSFMQYFSQSYLDRSGLASYLSSPTAYKKNLAAGKARGRSAGYATGYEWIVKAGVFE
jgi:hypothetical protein